MPSAPAQIGKAATPRRRRAKRPADSGPGSLQLLEEAFHLLRTTPAAGLWLYFAGTVPFVLTVFYFWADMSRSSHARGDAALGALGVAAAYLWMKGWQGWFCRRLWEQLHPTGAPAGLSRPRMIRYLAAQMFLHALALPVRIVSLIFIGWTSAFFQNATVLAFTQDFGRQPLRRTVAAAAHYAHRDWEQNYALLLLAGLIGFFVWANVMGTMVLIPMAIRMFFGIESVFTLNPESTILNSTFLFASALIVFLAIDPLLKAAYTLRCFRAASRTTGADLISRLEKRRAVALISLTLLFGCFPMPAARAQEAAPTPAELRGTIEETLRKKEYQWRYPRKEEVVDTGEKSWLTRALTDLANSIERSIDRAKDAWDRLVRRLFDKDKTAKRETREISGLGLSAVGVGLVGKVMLIVAVSLLLLWVGVLVYRRARQEAPITAEDDGFAGAIDLESESIVATQLPEDEWMRLAREQIARGEHRLAIRALFLANLAHLGDRGLLNVARFKSNRDYARELLLKARSHPELRDAFGENVGLFERVWYGLHEAGREAIDHFTANYERISRAGDPAP